MERKAQGRGDVSRTEWLLLLLHFSISDAAGLVERRRELSRDE